MYKQSLTLRKAALGDDHPGVAQSLNNLAECLRALVVICILHYFPCCFLNFIKMFAQGKYEEALPMYKEALVIDKKALGDDHPDVAIDLNNLAVCLQQMVY